MFKLISLAMHFSHLNPSPIDPIVAEMLRRELNKESQKADDNVVPLQHAEEQEPTREAA